jgi:hypothetical protein
MMKAHIFKIRAIASSFNITSSAGANSHIIHCPPRTYTKQNYCEQTFKSMNNLSRRTPLLIYRSGSVVRSAREHSKETPFFDHVALPPDVVNQTDEDDKHDGHENIGERHSRRSAAVAGGARGPCSSSLEAVLTGLGEIGGGLGVFS